jgi:hypothetical protein
VSVTGDLALVERLAKARLRGLAVHDVAEARRVSKRLNENHGNLDFDAPATV